MPDVCMYVCAVWFTLPRAQGCAVCGPEESMGGEDHIFSSGVRHNYYGEALQAKRGPVSCPKCKHVGRFAGTLNEIYRRIPRTQWESLVLCHACGENVLRHEDMATRRRVWYCASCEISLCTRCQR